MVDRHNKFVHAENMKDFQRRLETEADPDKRRLLEQLLAEEAANKLPHPKPNDPDE
ncbi:hypothetical protein SAZ10_23850 [Mesorhizobium sp. BAC0120]|uniref:hypothetical protein n=1 Tax=Mesorhizobium sp. BAC0120 TaxID=3090670 RepID=UPI00298C8A4E|nr:hypothetical protein [Mesorhizobium sp. BAC0120]MDW6024793.1 hypothetical protein [Mesorhizobium sp. BAC0120]